MRITQGTFSYLPDLTDAEIAAQIDYASTDTSDYVPTPAVA